MPVRRSRRATARAAGLSSSVAGALAAVGSQPVAEIARDQLRKALHVLAEEAGVVLGGLAGQGLQTCPTAQRRSRFVEGDMSVSSDTQNLQVNSTRLFNPVFVPLTKSNAVQEICRH